jgi:hypothetical protein
MKHQKEENQKNKQQKQNTKTNRKTKMNMLHHNIPAAYATQVKFPNEQTLMRGPPGRHGFSCHT